MKAVLQTRARRERCVEHPLRAEALYNLVLPPQIEMLEKMAKESPDLPVIEKDLFTPKRVAFSEVTL
jgi:hypothetical protein